MAIISKQEPGTAVNLPPWPQGELCPKGPHIGQCIEIEERYGFKYYNDYKKQEVVEDQIIFLFSVVHNGVEYQIPSRWMSMSGNPKSNLSKFLASWLGDVPDSFDTDTLKEKYAFLNISHYVGKMATYANIQSIMPAPSHMTMPQNAAAVITKAVVKESVEEPDSEIPF